MENVIVHPISPVFDKNSRVLILGSFPSTKSREQMFFYGHPQNRFWKVLALVYGCNTPESIEEKRVFLLTHNIAVWDVLASCSISGSSDNSIKNAVPNDLGVILNTADIKRICVNGKTAEKYYNKFIKPKLGREAFYLPSTSPANAAWSAERLAEKWKTVLYG